MLIIFRTVVVETRTEKCMVRGDTNHGSGRLRGKKQDFKYPMLNFQYSIFKWMPLGVEH
jgi:hypothetical protein